MYKYKVFIGQFLMAFSSLFIVFKMGPILIAFLMFVAGSIIYLFARKRKNSNDS
jgi:hypothetical protein